MSTTFLLTTLVIVATPGTGVLYTLSAGLSRGTRAAVVAAAGCTLGIVPHMAAAITGLAAVLHASGVAYNALKYLGVAYLIYMHSGSAAVHQRSRRRARHGPSAPSATSARSPSTTARRARRLASSPRAC